MEKTPPAKAELRFESSEGIEIVSATDTSSKKLRPYLRVNLRRGTVFLWKNLVQFQAGRRVLVTWQRERSIESFFS